MYSGGDLWKISLPSLPSYCEPKTALFFFFFFFFFKHLYNPLWSEQWIWDHFSPVQDPSLKSESEVAQSCLTLSDPMDCSLQGSSIHGIFQARVLEWIAISFSRESSRLRD